MEICHGIVIFLCNIALYCNKICRFVSRIKIAKMLNYMNKVVNYCYNIVVNLWVFRMESGREHNSLLWKRQE